MSANSNTTIWRRLYSRAVAHKQICRGQPYLSVKYLTTSSWHQFKTMLIWIHGLFKIHFKFESVPDDKPVNQTASSTSAGIFKCLGMGMLTLNQTPELHKNNLYCMKEAMDTLNKIQLFGSKMSFLLNLVQRYYG